MDANQQGDCVGVAKAGGATPPADSLIEEFSSALELCRRATENMRKTDYLASACESHPR